jgi:hypothetical protein
MVIGVKLIVVDGNVYILDITVLLLCVAICQKSIRVRSKL